MAHGVVLDTNALLLFGDGIDVFAELERLFDVSATLLVPEQVMAEMERQARGATRDARKAKLALSLVREKLRRQADPGLVARLFLPRKKEIPLKIVPGSGIQHADDAILRIAEDERAAVVTIDEALQRRLLAKGLRVVGVKSGKLASMS